MRIELRFRQELEGGEALRSKDVVGKRIVKVEQSRASNGRGKMVWDVEALVLEDGTRLIPVTVETEGDYFHKFIVNKPEPKTM